MRSTIRVSAFSAGLAAILLAGQVWGAGPVKLRYKFKKGETLKYSMVMDQAMDISSDAMPGMTNKITMRMNMDMYQKALEIKKNGARIEMGFSKFDAEMKMGGRSMPVPGMEGVTKLRLGLDMSDRGEMGEAKLLNPDEVDETAKQIADSMQNNMAQNSLMFPDKALKPGDTWEIDQAIPTAIPGAKDLKMKLKSKYTLVGMEKVKGQLCAKIRADVKLALHGKAESGGYPVQADMDGSGTGENLFAIDEGQMVSSKASFKVAGGVVATAQGQKMANKLSMEVKLEMTRK